MTYNLDNYGLGSKLHKKGSWVYDSCAWQLEVICQSSHICYYHLDIVVKQTLDHFFFHKISSSWFSIFGLLQTCFRQDKSGSTQMILSLLSCQSSSPPRVSIDKSFYWSDHKKSILPVECIRSSRASPAKSPLSLGLATEPLLIIDDNHHHFNIVLFYQSPKPSQMIAIIVIVHISAVDNSRQWTTQPLMMFDA